MIGTQRRRSSRTVVLAAGVFFATNIGLMHLAGAQAAGAVDSGSPVRATAPANFLTAPSIALGYAPAAMAGGDLTGSGHTDLVTADPATGEVIVYLSDGLGGFAAPARFAAVANPDAVAIADVDGDGKPDVIVASATTGTIAVLPGRGNGTLGSPRSFAVGFNGGSLAAGDLTGNGHADVAVTGLTTRAVAVLVNDGKGNLAKPVLLATAQLSTGLAVGDFNHDGRPDLAVAQSTGNVEIFLGQGGGQFRASADVRAVAGPVTSISAGDFNWDGKIDLAVTAANGNAVAVLLGKGDGTFATPAVYAVGNTPVKVFVADTDGDGVPDLIIVNRGSNTFSVLKGAGDGTFEPAQHFVAGNGPVDLAAGSFYGNGHVDLAVLNGSGQTVSVAAANGDGTFHAARSYTVDEQPVAVATGDVNGDGRPDLVVAKSCAVEASCGTSGSAQVLLGQADGTYQIGASYALGAGPAAIALIDANGDKHPDLVVANRVDKTLTVRLGLGDGTFGQAMTVSLAGAPKALAAGHFHDNGMTDLAVVEDCGSKNCSNRGQVEILRGAGDGSFQSAALLPAGYAPVGLAAGSLDGSGKADIVVANRCGASADCSAGGTATVLLGDGTGNFKAGKSFGLGTNPAAIALGDLTGSGVLDAVVTRGTDHAVAVFRGKGDGTFASGVAYRVGTGPGALVIADFNGDGKPDVAVANGGDATVSVLFGQGDGSLQSAFALPVSGNPESLAAIGGPATTHASLATTNGSTGSATSAQSSITVISNVNEAPALTGGPVPAINLTWTAGSSSPSSVNESVSFTATVLGTPAAGAPKGGSVEFFSDGAAISDCGGASGMSVTAGSGTSSTAVCVTSALTASASGHAITAQYLGANDTVYDNSAVSDPITQVVSPLAPKIDLTTVSPSPASPQSVDTAVTFTATLSGVTFAPTPPTGTVEFQADGTTISKCSTQGLSPSGSKYQAQCSTSSLPATPSPHSIVAIFNGNNADTNYSAATSSSISYTIKPATPTLSLTATPGDSEPVNTSVTFTAQLSGSFPAAVPPDGTVSFKINGAASASCPAATVSANGSASCTTSSLVAPSDKVEATYSGDSNYTVANTATAFETITQATPVVTIQQPSPAPVVNQQVTLTAQVAATGAGTASAVAPTGSVTFAPTGSTCTSPVGLTGNPGTAPCSYTFTQASSGITIKATYGGDADYSAGSATVSQVVNAASTTVGLTPTPSNPAVNAQVSFQATVTPQFAGTTVPTGSVIITDTTTSTQICKQKLSGGAVSACTYTFTTSGTHNVAAAYTSGDSNFTAPSQPTTIAVNVGAGTTSVALTSSSNNWTVNQAVTFTATINAGGTMPGLAGSMVIFDQTTSASLCTVSVSGNGTVQCKMTQGFTMAGLNSVVAEFTSSNHNFASINSAALAQTVNQDSTTTGTPSASPSPSAVGQAVQFNATVTPTITGSVKPTGTVTVSANLGGAISQCQFTLPGTSCSITLTQAGKYSVTATYAGDANFSGSSTTTAATQTVGPENESIVIAGPYSCSPTATPSAANGNTGCCLPGLVNKACTGYATPLTQAPTVNQQVYFSATLKPTNPGSTVPIGPLLFNARDNNGNKSDAATCQTTPLSKANVGSATTPVYVSAAACGVTFLSATKTTNNGSNVTVYSVFATFAGDTNFPAQSSSPFFVSSVLQAGTSLSLTPDAASVMASQPMTFTATLSAVSPGATAPTGPTNTVQFNFSPATNVVQEGVTPAPGTLPCSAQPVSISKGVVTATCTVVFEHSAAPTQGPVMVTAAYSGDANFKTSSTPSATAETVQDFGESLTVTPGTTAVIITKPCTSVIGPATPNCSIDLGQGFANVSGDKEVADPLNPATIALTLTGVNGFTDPLNVVCTVNAVNVPEATPSSPTVAPLCLPSTSQLTTPSYASTTPLSFQIVALPSATVGEYSITISVSDKSVSALSGNNTSYAISTSILSVSGPLDLASGASGTTQAIFNTAAVANGTALGPKITCSVFTANGVPVTTFTATCTGPSSITSTGAATGVPISISFQPTAKAALVQSSTRMFAAAFATPLFAMIVWLGVRKSPRRNFFRFLGMVLVIVGMTSLNGCGGNFTGPNISVKTPIPPGAYYIEAVTTDSSGNSYYTVIPVEITAE